MQKKPLYIPQTLKDTNRLSIGVLSRLTKKGADVRYQFHLYEIIVTAWYRYPSYDFIFGVPTGEMAKKEKACMVIRDAKDIRILWFDGQELDDTIKAILSVRNGCRHCGKHSHLLETNCRCLHCGKGN